VVGGSPSRGTIVIGRKRNGDGLIAKILDPKGGERRKKKKDQV